MSSFFAQRYSLVILTYVSVSVFILIGPTCHVGIAASAPLQKREKEIITKDLAGQKIFFQRWIKKKEEFKPYQLELQAFRFVPERRVGRTWFLTDHTVHHIIVGTIYAYIQLKSESVDLDTESTVSELCNDFVSDNRNLLFTMETKTYPTERLPIISPFTDVKISTTYYYNAEVTFFFMDPSSDSPRLIHKATKKLDQSRW